MLYEIKTEPKTDIFSFQEPQAFIHHSLCSQSYMCEGNQTHSWKRNMRVGRFVTLKLLAQEQWHMVTPSTHTALDTHTHLHTASIFITWNPPLKSPKSLKNQNWELLKNLRLTRCYAVSKNATQTMVKHGSGDGTWLWRGSNRSFS